MDNHKTELAGNGFADVVLEAGQRSLDRLFTYSVPDGLRGILAPGHRVLVPLGTKEVEGWVIALRDETPVAGTRPVLRLLEDRPPVDGILLALAHWVAGEYLCPLGLAIKAFVPRRAGQRQGVLVSISGEAGGVRDMLPAMERRSPRMAAVLRNLLEEGPRTTVQLRESLRADSRVLKNLKDRGLITLGPLPPEPVFHGSQLQLNPEQGEAVKAIKDSLHTGESKVFLLHGITGSGKTAVYQAAAGEALRLGRQVMILVPEIVLTDQVVSAFRSGWGREVAVLHSRLTPGEKFKEWERIRAGGAPVVVGARSGVFAPLERLGLVVLDEEHEASYQQEQNPRYHAREVAFKRASLQGATVVLGSATPSLESYYRAETGLYHLLSLSKRPVGRQLPSVAVVDMRTEGGRLISTSLEQRIAACLERREQGLLFINRRGYATTVVCRLCGENIRCPRCDIPLTYHLDGDKLLCHYCGHVVRRPRSCPACGEKGLTRLGWGTQQVESEVKRIFPGVRVLRVDGDSVRKVRSGAGPWEAFAGGEADIMVGTQMIAHGLDFPRLTLVGVVLADTLFAQPDFRAGERAFALLTQVAGRAGRGDLPGEVVLQTFNPGEPAVVGASKQDYLDFYRREIMARWRLGYPPFSQVVRLRITGTEGGGTLVAARMLGENLATRGGDWRVLGPAPTPLPRVGGSYHFQVTLNGPDLAGMRQAARETLDSFAATPSGRRVRVFVDINPLGW